MHFSPSSLPHLIQQRAALEKAELAFKHQKQWIQKREELEKAIFQLQEEINQDFYKRHQKGKWNEETTLHFQYTKEEKQKRLRQLKQAQIKIDEWLDQAEDVTEENLLQQRSQLLHAIWQLYPAKREEQEAKWREWNQLRILEIELLGIEKVLERLSEHLSLAIQTRQSIKGRGLLNYIFGLSPNIVIERQLIGIHALILNTLPLLEKISQQPSTVSFQRLLQDLAAWLEQLKNVCLKSWNFRRLDALFGETEPVLKQFIERSKHQQSQFVSEIQILNEEMNHWIYQL